MRVFWQHCGEDEDDANAESKGAEFEELAWLPGLRVIGIAGQSWNVFCVHLGLLQLCTYLLEFGLHMVIMRELLTENLETSNIYEATHSECVEYEHCSVVLAGYSGPDDDAEEWDDVDREKENGHEPGGAAALEEARGDSHGVEAFVGCNGSEEEQHIFLWALQTGGAMLSFHNRKVKYRRHPSRQNRLVT